MPIRRVEIERVANVARFFRVFLGWVEGFEPSATGTTIRRMSSLLVRYATPACTLTFRLPLLSPGFLPVWAQVWAQRLVRCSESPLEPEAGREDPVTSRKRHHLRERGRNSEAESPGSDRLETQASSSGRD